MWAPPTLTSVACERLGLSRERRRRLLDFPSLPPQPPLHIARGANEVVLQFHFGQTAIARPAQAVRPDQFALRAFDGIAMFHPHFEGVGLLLLAPALQQGVVLADHQ